MINPIKNSALCSPIARNKKRKERIERKKFR
jgi:hypothetical protein